MKALSISNYFNYKLSTPAEKDKKRVVHLQNCPSLFKSPKKIILNSSSYKSFILENKPNKTFEKKYPVIAANTSVPLLKPNNNALSIKQYSNIPNLIPRPRLTEGKAISRNKPIYHFNTFNSSQQQCKSQEALSTSPSSNSTHANNIKLVKIEYHKADLISVRSFIDELSNVKNAIKENLYYYPKIQQCQTELKDYINATLKAYLIIKPPHSNEDKANQPSSVQKKTIAISNKYQLELKLMSYSIQFKELGGTGSNKTIDLPFEFIIYFLCCQKQIDLILSFLSYNAEKKEFAIDHTKFKLAYLSQVSIEWLNYTYKEPISSIWITNSEIYQFTTVLPQMTFTLIETSSPDQSKQLCHFSKALDSQAIINLMKDNFNHWDLLVLNSFSIYKSFRKEIVDIFSLKHKNPINRSFSKTSLIPPSIKHSFKRFNEGVSQDDEEKLQMEQLSKPSWDFISTINNITHCHTLFSFKIDIKLSGGIIRSLQLSLKQLKQIAGLSDQWSLYETIRRLVVVDDNYVPKLNLLYQEEQGKKNESSACVVHGNVFHVLKMKRSASIRKEEEVPLHNKKEPNGFSYFESNKMQFKIVDPFFVNEEKVVYFIPMNLLIQMAKLNFSEWPLFIRNHYDTLFYKKIDDVPANKKKGIRSSKSLRIGLIKRRFQGT